MGLWYSSTLIHFEQLDMMPPPLIPFAKLLTVESAAEHKASRGSWQSHVGWLKQESLTELLLMYHKSVPAVMGAGGFAKSNLLLQVRMSQHTPFLIVTQQCLLQQCA